MPRILIVIARLNVGGTAQYINELTHGLIGQGHEVLVATGYVQNAEVEDEVLHSLPIHRIPTMGRKISLSKDLQARKELKKLIADFNPDLIYSHTFKAGLLARSFTTDIPRLHAFHGHLLSDPEFKGWKSRVVVIIERLLAPRTRYLITVGKKVAEELLAQKVGKSEQYCSIAPGVRPLALEDRNQARSALNVADEKRPIVVWMARVTAVKAPQRVAYIARNIPEARFLLAGGGDLMEEISIDPPKNLTVVGWQPATRMWAVADIAISTSENEGMPVALIEAQLAGIPVVALNVGSVSEVIQDGITGFVLEEFGDEFMARLRLLLTSEELRLKLSNSAKSRAQSEFSPTQLVSEHVTLFDKALNK